MQRLPLPKDKSAMVRKHTQTFIALCATGNTVISCTFSCLASQTLKIAAFIFLHPLEYSHTHKHSLIVSHLWPLLHRLLSLLSCLSKSFSFFPPVTAVLKCPSTFLSQVPGKTPISAVFRLTTYTSNGLDETNTVLTESGAAWSPAPLALCCLLSRKLPGLKSQGRLPVVLPLPPIPASCPK